MSGKRCRAHPVSGLPTSGSVRPGCALGPVRTLLLTAVAVLGVALPSAPALAEKRIALVIGNSAYQHVAPLRNPRNDATLIAETLRGLGFGLVGGRAQLDLDKRGVDAAVQDFGKLLEGADVGLFYYAGNGVQVRGANYLVPIGADPTRRQTSIFKCSTRLSSCARWRVPAPSSTW
jgi:hypothetical protein